MKKGFIVIGCYKYLIQIDLNPINIRNSPHANTLM